MLSYVRKIIEEALAERNLKDLKVYRLQFGLQGGLSS